MDNLISENNLKQKYKAVANLTDVHGQLVLGRANLFTQGTAVGRFLLFRLLKRLKQSMDFQPCKLAPSVL